MAFSFACLACLDVATAKLAFCSLMLALVMYCNFVPSISLLLTLNIDPLHGFCLIKLKDFLFYIIRILDILGQIV